MVLREVEYRGLIAQAWDALRGDTSLWPDRTFYIEMIKRAGEPVLDVGCGTGRLLLDYLALGIDIDGVDNSADMLAVCLDKAERRGLAPRVFEQHVEALALPRRYRTILIPSSTIQLVIDPAVAVAALARVREHLLPGGVCVASFMGLWREGRPLEYTREDTAPADAGEAIYRRRSWSRYDPVSECVDTEDLYQVLEGGRVVREELHRREQATRSYTPAQAVALFTAAGFTAVTARREFTFDPVDAKTNVCTVAGVAPESGSP